MAGRVRRRGSGALHTTSALGYRPVTTDSDEFDAPMKAVHGEMRKAEERFARQAADADAALVVCDGPLTFEEKPGAGAVVGYIKRIQELDTVAGAIEALGESNRMVGIITHVGALTHRLPARIEVTKSAEKSSVKVVDEVHVG